MLENLEQVTKQGCIDYISSYIESMKDEIEAGSKKELLYTERILFFKKTLEFLINGIDIEKASEKEDVIKEIDKEIGWLRELFDEAWDLNQSDKTRTDFTRKVTTYTPGIIQTLSCFQPNTIQASKKEIKKTKDAVKIFLDRKIDGEIGDFVKCTDCECVQLIQPGGTACGCCESENLQWVDNENPEMTEEKLEKLDYILEYM